MIIDFDTSSIRDREDLLAFACALGERSAQHYDRLAAAMRRNLRDDLAELYEGLSKNTRHRQDQLQQLWPDLLTAHPDGSGHATIPALPEPDATEELALQSAYHCLANAVRWEQTAFTCFSYLAAESKDPEVSALAEALAQEKLQQAAQLRVHRRRAYRQGGKIASPWPSAKQISSLGDLLTAAEAGERRFLEIMSSSGASPLVVSKLERMAEETLRQIGLSTGEQSDLPENAPKTEALGKQDSRGVHTLSLREAHAAFDFYDSVAGAAQHEDVMEAAQHLSVFALERIRLLHALDA